jgi:DNA modification methylase
LAGTVPASWEIIEGDALERIGEIDPASVQMCVTSPPYWGLRDYGHSDQLGLEPTPEAYVERMVALFRGVRRVLRDDGTLWLNLGDSYATPKVGNTNGLSGEKEILHAMQFKKLLPPGLKPKDLVGIPWRVAFALQADGWYLRSDIIWAKPNPMPESVTDRPTKAHEYLFLLTKSPRYYYDAEAIKLHSPAGGTKAGYCSYSKRARAMGREPSGNEKPGAVAYNKDTANRRSVWTIPTQPFPGAHFAVFPPALVEPCVLAGSRENDLVLDPFAGSGTVGVVCRKYSRRFVGIELSPEYAAMARGRLGGYVPDDEETDGTPTLWSTG